MATDPSTSGPWPFWWGGGRLGMAPIHGRVSRGGGAVLDRGRRHGGVGGMGGARGHRRAGHARTERVVDHRGHPPLVATVCPFEGRRHAGVATTDFLTSV